jgi:hypothetical protein
VITLFARDPFVPILAASMKGLSRSSSTKDGTPARDSQGEKREAAPPLPPDGQKQADDGPPKAGSTARKYVPL